MITRKIFITHLANIDAGSEYYGIEPNYTEYGTQSATNSSLAGSAVLTGTTAEVLYTLNAAAMEVLFRGTTTAPVKLQITACGCCSTNSSGVYVGVKTEATYVVKWTQAQAGASLTPYYPSNAVSTGEITPPVTLRRTSTVALCAKKQRSSQWVGIDMCEITLWFDEEPAGAEVAMTYDGVTQVLAAGYEEAVSVVYHGTQIAEGTCVLRCGGKVMRSDITVAGRTLKCAGRLMKSDIIISVDT